MHDTKCKPDGETCCDDECSSGARNKYFVGKRLSPESFRNEQHYHIGRRRLLNRAIHGCGIVQGFTIETAPVEGGKLAIQLLLGPGLALDAAGRELLLPEETTLAFGDLHVAEVKKDTPAPIEPSCWLLSAHYAERPIDPISLRDACSCERKEWNRICETIVFCLRPCKEGDCQRCCDPGERCPDCNDDGARDGRSTCEVICDTLTQTPPEPPDETWIEVCGARVDVSAGVPLACITVGEDCGKWAILEVDEICAARQFVKRNDLLFDLIPDRDLTCIEEVSWEAIHRQSVPFVQFADFFPEVEKEGDKCLPCDTKFSVRFSGPVQARTVTTDCVAMRVYFRDGGWDRVLHVPIAAFHPDEELRATSAHIVVDGEWVEEKIKGTPEDIFRRPDLPVHVEIEIRGDYILDCCGRALDANARGLVAAPGGNGTPGGTLLSRFWVEPAPHAENANTTYSRA